MSELMNAVRCNGNIRWQLLATVSAAALVTSMCVVSRAQAANPDSDRPTVWIELGAQLEKVKGFGEPYAAPFVPELMQDGFDPLGFERALGQSLGGEGKISFQPENSGWIFSVSARFGRANGGALTHQQTPGCPCLAHVGTNPPGYISVPGAKFFETRVHNDESHAILDFLAGKDVGLGLFGGGGKSTVQFGVRVAQFTSKQVLGMNADPDFYVPSNAKYAQHHHTYSVTSHTERSFHGVGPSLAWNGSAPLFGSRDESEVTLDWGANVSVLFGRQKISGHHQTTGVYYKRAPKYSSVTPIQRSGDISRSRSVVVPNVGGLAGVSFRFPNAKVSLGYRVDFFFGAIDGGIDTRKSETLGFYGPFATISIGLGG